MPISNGKRSQLKSGRKPVHQTTLLTSMTRSREDALDSYREQVLLAVAEKRTAAVPDVWAHLAADRCVDSEDVRADEHEHLEADPSTSTFDRHRNLPCVGARENDLV